MSFEFNKIKKPVIITGVTIACFILIDFSYNVIKNRADMANILAIAGVSGPKIYTIEPSRNLLFEIELAKSDPKQVIDKLEQVLRIKMIEYGSAKNQIGDPKSANAKLYAVKSYAYAVRIIMLKNWKPGMSRKKIIQYYNKSTNYLTAEYDFKDNPESYLGFK
jgi:hypothetical protein